MRIRMIVAVIAVIAIGQCTGRQPTPQRSAAKARMEAARRFTKDCAVSRLSEWKVSGRAAGSDCGILLIDSPVTLEDAIVEAMHYGTGAYNLYRGGINKFSHERSFRGVVYHDHSGQVWLYGEVSNDEMKTLRPCD